MRVLIARGSCVSVYLFVHTAKQDPKAKADDDGRFGATDENRAITWYVQLMKRNSAYCVASFSSLF